MKALNAGGLGKNHDSTNIWLHYVLSMVQPPSVIHTAVMDHGKLVTLITGKRHHLLFTGDNDEVCMTRSFNVMSKTI